MSFFSGRNWESQLAQVPDQSVQVALVEFPYNEADRYQAFGGAEALAAAAAYLQACRHVLQQLRRVLDDAVVYVVDLPRWLPFHALALEEEGLRFKNWIAVAVAAAAEPPGASRHLSVPLTPVHTGILVYVTDPVFVALQKVREPHQTCRRCHLPLADWGGKKAQRNPAGRVISDIWVHTPFFPPEALSQAGHASSAAAASSSQTPGSQEEAQAEILRRLFGLARGQGRRAAVVVQPEFADELPAPPPNLPTLSISQSTPEPAPTQPTPTRPTNVQPLLQRDQPLAARPLYEPLPLDPTAPLALDTLYQADVVAALRHVPDDSIDLAFADPPYNLEKEYSRYEDDRQESEYLRWCEEWLAEYVRILKPTGSLFVVNLPRWAVHHAAYLSSRLYLQHWIAWDALSEPRGRIMPAHYAVLYYTKSPTGFTFHPQRCYPPDYCFRARCVRRRDPQAETMPLTDIWYDIHRIRHRRDRDAHPCQLPLRLLDRIIEMATNPGQVVLDGFAGTGSAMITAYQRGRHFIGVDIDPKYLTITAHKLRSQLPIVER
ncbi:MAG: site-specific DNA-methyltransferase [Limnochordaceae bacterium]|nr:site-specific DNA-methyltransferase [Limnochordaceae bacterium]